MYGWGATNPLRKVEYANETIPEIVYLIIHEYGHYLKNSRSVLDTTHQYLNRYRFNLKDFMNNTPPYPAYKVKNSKTIVLQYSGEFYPIATPEELWGYVKDKYRIQDGLPELTEEEVKENQGGIAEVDIYFNKNLA